MSEEMIAFYENNDSNNSLSNQTDNCTIQIYALGPPLATISSTCIIIGTIFSLICIYRYLRQPNLRNHFTYLFHYMLLFCLLFSFINVPVFLMGYYLNFFENSPRLCQYYSVNASAINIAILTCLAHASLERNYFIFRKAGLLTWRRQVIPILCLTFYSYFISILFVFIPQCDYIPCAPCHTRHLKYLIPWLILSFLLPELIMLSSTIILILRLSRQQIHLNRSKEGNTFRRIVIQMTLYMIWSCLYYCPPTFYNLALVIDFNGFSPLTSSAMIIVSTVSVQSYPILTFILMINYHRRINLKKRIITNKSMVNRHVLSTITE